MFVSIGITTVDFFISGLDRIPTTEGDEFTLESLEFLQNPLTMVLGGNGANTAYVLGKLGAAVTLCSIVGRDLLADFIHTWLHEAKVDTAGLIQSEIAATSTTTVVTDQRLNRIAFHHQGASEIYRLNDVPSGLLDQAAVVLVSGNPLLPAWRPEGGAQALRQAHQSKAITALDIGPAIGRPTELAEIQSSLPFIDYLMANDHELMTCVAERAIETAIEHLFIAGTKCLVRKQGPAGATIYQANQSSPIHVPSFEVEARFTVGAGDSFNAGFLYALHQRWDLTQALRFAHAVAALVVSNAQGVLGAPTLEQVQTLLAD